MNESDWLSPSNAQEAKDAQSAMAEKVIVKDDFGPLQWIGGMDVSNFRFDPNRRIFAACVVLAKESRKVEEVAVALQEWSFPYIPGLLAFREAPALVAAFKKLKRRPDLLMLDGQGISHPRGLGIASHLGVLLDIPTIGVAKSILVGAPTSVLGMEAGSQVPLVYNGKCVAMLLRSKKNTKPLVISIGHRISLDTALILVKSMLGGYRLPEPTRQAHIAANAFRRKIHS